MIIINKSAGWLYCKGLPPSTVSALKETLSLPNLKYVLMLRLKKYAPWVKPTITYYKEHPNGTFLCPRGTLHGLLEHLYNKGLDYELFDQTVSVGLNKPLESSIQLRPYQEEVMDQITGREDGVFRLSVGWGKSILALKLIEKFQETALIIVPRSHLLEQYAKDIKKFFNIEAGIIQGARCDIKDITLATIQTIDRMCKKKSLEAISNRFSILFYDECQGAITKSRMKAIQSFNCKRLFGMSGTIDREDFQGPAIKFLFGRVLVDAELPQMKPIVKVYKSNIHIPARDYSVMETEQIENVARNQFIADIIKEEIKNGRKLMVFCKRVDHLKLIKDLLPDSNKTIVLYADEKKEIKNEMLDKLRKNEIEFDVLLASFSYAAVGTDIPALDSILFAGALKGNILNAQSLGRCLRIFPSKKQPVLHDIWDNLSPIYHRQWKYREKLYKSKGYEVLIN